MKSNFKVVLVLLTFVLGMFDQASAITREIKFVYDPKRNLVYQQRTDLCYTPDWANNLFAYTPNSSYMDTEAHSVLGESRITFNDQEFLGGPTLDRGSAISLRTQYQDMMSSVESQNAYDQSTDHASQRGFFQRVKDFSSYVVRSMFSFQLKEGFKKAEKKNDAVRTFTSVQKSIKQVAYHSLNVSVASTFKFGTKTDLPQQSGMIWLASPLFDGRLEVNFGESWKPKQTAEDALKNGLGKELFSAHVSRPITKWGLASGLSYGGTSTNLTASLSSPLPGNVRGVYSYAYGINSSKTTVPGGREQRVTFLYDFTF